MTPYRLSIVIRELAYLGSGWSWGGRKGGKMSPGIYRRRGVDEVEVVVEKG